MSCFGSAQRRIILGVDPGLASVGWGVLEADGVRLRHIAHGCITTKSTQEKTTRLKKIFEEFNVLIDQYSPHESGMETLYFSKNISSALPVSEAKGVLTLALALKGIPLKEFQPVLVKQTVLGVGSGDKKQIQEMLRLLLALDAVPKPDHAADALAVAICCAHNAVSACLPASVRAIVSPC